MKDYLFSHDLVLNTKIAKTLKLGANACVTHILHLWDGSMTDTFEHVLMFQNLQRQLVAIKFVLDLDTI